ncbi:MAG TPA: hypothetical protein VFV99_18680 [Kofleriaceae bacterium]|nr:hypothetical protein [Kofleriaceae bacterium]
MLEHLDRHHAIEAHSRKVERADVGGAHGDKTAGGGAGGRTWFDGFDYASASIGADTPAT